MADIRRRGKYYPHFMRRIRALIAALDVLNALDRDIEIVIRKKPRSRPAARISVVAA